MWINLWMKLWKVWTTRPNPSQENTVRKDGNYPVKVTWAYPVGGNARRGLWFSVPAVGSRVYVIVQRLPNEGSRNTESE